jgi:hypothetical protein
LFSITVAAAVTATDIAVVADGSAMMLMVSAAADSVIVVDDAFEAGFVMKADYNAVVVAVVGIVVLVNAGTAVVMVVVGTGVGIVAGYVAAAVNSDQGVVGISGYFVVRVVAQTRVWIAGY